MTTVGYVPDQPSTDRTEVSELVRRARDGDATAWDALVERFGPLLTSIARRHRLSDDDGRDVAQTIWLRLFESIDRIRDPQRLPGWIATSARRECLRVLRSSGREVPTEDAAHDVVSHAFPAPDQRLLVDEERAAVRAAVDTLADRHRTLVRTLLASPQPSYDAISLTLGMPVGSIGPTRMRALGNLRRRPAIAALAS